MGEPSVLAIFFLRALLILCSSLSKCLEQATYYLEQATHYLNAWNRFLLGRALAVGLTESCCDIRNMSRQK